MTQDSLDQGAHWIHSIDANPITTAARELGVDTLFVGGDSSYTKLTEATPHDGGKHLQLYVYGRAAHAAFPEAPSVRADYWFT